jgi:hypothetical protein
VSQSYEEVQIFDGVAERTGNRIDRAGVRGRQTLCRSFTDLGAKWRRLGDGYYYLPAAAWPAESEKCDLKRSWDCVA